MGGEVHGYDPMMIDMSAIVLVVNANYNFLILPYPLGIHVIFENLVMALGRAIASFPSLD